MYTFTLFNVLKKYRKYPYIRNISIRYGLRIRIMVSDSVVGRCLYPDSLRYDGADPE
jgi:hypothetical protein